MKAHIECDVQLFVTEHKTEINPRTGRPLKGYVYLQTQNLKEPQLLIFDKGIFWDKFLSQIEGIR